MMQIFIEPSDVLLFRDGRPFAAGQDHRAVSVFPPSPLTLQGAIRSRALADAFPDEHSFFPTSSAEIGYSSDYGKLRLRGPFLAREHGGALTRYFPVPADVVTAGCGHPVALQPLPASEEFPFLSGSPAPHLLWARTSERVEAAAGWLSETELQRYLDGRSFELTREDGLFQRETRSHTGIDSSVKRPRQDDMGGHLFQIEFVRLHAGTGLWAEVAGLPIKPHGLLRIGGEGRAATYREVAGAVLSSERRVRGRFKLYFATAAFFSGGWQPTDWSRFLQGGGVRLVAAAVSRFEPLAGFDLAKKQHKPMSGMVPPGSVYFFESEAEVTVADAVTDDRGPEKLGQIGFGQVFVGRWEYV